MATTRVRVVCFDIGGVLVRHCRTWAEGCRAAGLPVHPAAETPEAVERRRELSRRHTTGQIGIAAFCEGVSDLLGRVYTPADVARIHRAWLGAEYAGVRDLVSRLLRIGRADAAVLSNTNDDHWARFDPPAGRPAEYPAVALIPHRFASHRMGLAKPQPEMYAAFEERMGLSDSPGSILFLDDLPDNVAAARSRGWTAELIDHGTETSPQIERILVHHGLLDST